MGRAARQRAEGKNHLTREPPPLAHSRRGTPTREPPPLAHSRRGTLGPAKFLPLRTTPSPCLTTFDRDYPSLYKKHAGKRIHWMHFPADYFFVNECAFARFCYTAVSVRILYFVKLGRIHRSLTYSPRVLSANRFPCV